MEQENVLKPIRAEKLPEWDDNEFCVSITKAAELSGLSESQIRYLESLNGVSIGKRGPKERNRVYTKQDVKLLWWISQQLDDHRPAEIADYLSQHQEDILANLGRITLRQVIDHEQESAGHDLLVSRLVSLILSMWQEAALGGGKKADAVIRGVIFGPKDAEWKDAFRQSVSERRAIDLAGSLLIWSSIVEEVEERKDLYVDPDIIFGNLDIIFSYQSWYLPISKKYAFDYSHFSDETEPFSVAIIWEPLSKLTAVHELQRSAQNVDELKKKLVNMLMRNLVRVLKATPAPTSLSASALSRGILGRHSVLRGLALLLDTCIEPYFPTCYSYIAKFGIGKYGPKEHLEVLESRGDEEVGYLPKVLATQDLPWWINYAQRSSSLALAQSASDSQFSHKGEHGSVICFPLITLDNVIGVMGIENLEDEVLKGSSGLTDADLLRYLICIAEIAAEYLNLTEASAQKAERSKLAYASEETVAWWLDIYHYGGLNYSRFIEKVCDWMYEKPLTQIDVVDLIVVDIFKESELASRYQGFELIIYIVRKTLERITDLIQSDPIARELMEKQQLMLYEPSIGEHVLFAAINIPKDYLLIFLEKIRRFWQRDLGDLFIWKGNDIDVSLQVGVCRFDGMARYQKEMAFQIMNYHVRELVDNFYDRDKTNKRPFNHVVEYASVIRTEKVHE